MTDQERTTVDALNEELDELLAAAEGPPTSSEAHAAREPLDREQREIKLNVLRMGALVEDAIRAAIAALVNHDPDAALAVIVGDGRINEAQRSVSTQIARTIATQQPVARDLRFLLSLDHVTYELERIGDHASSVA
jgi:phosphate transport system protein